MTGSKLPLWKKNPGIFAHIGWDAQEILETGPKLMKVRHRPCSFEGLGFSVSVHPRQWAYIMSDALGINDWGDIPVLVLTFDKPALDFYAFIKPIKQIQSSKELTEWGTREGLIKTATDLMVYNEDKFEWEQFPEEYFSRSEVKGQKFEVVPGWRPTAKLAQRVRKCYSAPTQGSLVNEVLNLWLADQHPEIGMVWYEHPYYPQYASIPQGHILPDHFDAVHPVTVTNVYKWPSVRKSLEKG